MPTALLVAHHYPPHIGGLGMVVQKQAQGLAENGFHVIVLTSKFGRSGRGSDVGPGIELIRVPCSHVLERVFGIVFPLFSPRLLWETWKQVRRANLVHIHDVFYMSSWVGGILGVLARKPMLLTQHVGMVQHSSGLVTTVQRLVYATVGRWLFSKARTIIVYNRNVHAFLRARGVPESRILRLANGIDTCEFRPATPRERADIRKRFGLPQDRPLVLFLGRLVEKKGYQILLGARRRMTWCSRDPDPFRAQDTVPTCTGSAPWIRHRLLSSIGPVTCSLFRQSGRSSHSSCRRPWPAVCR
jgi:D-inositol-3-phosphate glycosyltransferase